MYWAFPFIIRTPPPVEDTRNSNTFFSFCCSNSETFQNFCCQNSGIFLPFSLEFQQFFKKFTNVVKIPTYFYIFHQKFLGINLIFPIKIPRNQFLIYDVFHRGPFIIIHPPVILIGLFLSC